MEPHNKYVLNWKDRKDFDFSRLRGASTGTIVESALARGIKVEILYDPIIEMKYDGTRSLFHAANSSLVSLLAAKVSYSKEGSNILLTRAGVKVPHGRTFPVGSTRDVQRFVDSLGIAVIKPDNGSSGSCVYCGVTPDRVSAILEEIGRVYPKVIVEELVQGKDYRVFATIDGKICVMERRPASVLGDGVLSIDDLIREKNLDRSPKSGPMPVRYPFTTIEIDDVVQNYLRQSGISLNDIPGRGQRVFLRGNANASTGGDVITIPSEIVHPKIKELALSVLDAVPGLPYAGVDIMVDDIVNPSNPNDATVIEFNEMPGLCGLTYPFQGVPQTPADYILDLVFPNSKK